MEYCVVGAGAIGGTVGARLARDGHDVLLCDADREHVQAINERGLRVSGAADLVGGLVATSDADELPPCDYGIVATKSMHTGAAIDATARAFARAAVCSVQNGAGNEEIIAERIERVIRGTTFPAGHVVEPGHIAMDTKGDTHIGPFEPRPAPLDRVRELADACTRGGMPTHALDDARGAQ